MSKNFYLNTWHWDDIDPRGRPTVTAGSDHYFRTCCLYVLPSVRPSPLLIISQIKFQTWIVIATGGTVGLAEWIISDTHVFLPFSSSMLEHVEKRLFLWRSVMDLDLDRLLGSLFSSACPLLFGIIQDRRCLAAKSSGSKGGRRTKLKQNHKFMKENK